MDMDIFYIFLSQLKTIRKMTNEKCVIEEEDVRELNLSDIVMPLMDRKFYEYSKENGLDQNEEYSEIHQQILMFTEGAIKKNPIIEKIYNSFEVKIDEDGELYIESTYPRVVSYLMRQAELDEGKHIFGDRDLILRTSVIYICICLETLICDILRDYYINIDSSDTFADKTISFDDLKKIGSVEDAKTFLIEGELDAIFRDSFKKWFFKVDKIFNTLKEFPEIENWIEEINELYQRRNLYVHANGIVNDYYLKLTSKEYIDNLQKGDIINTNPDYIISKIELIERMGWLIYYKYQCYKNKGIDEALFTRLNNLIIDNIRSNYRAIPMIYDSLLRSKKLSDTDMLYAKMNKYLFYKLNGGFDDVKKELEEFNASIYSIQFVMAKAILLEEDDAFDKLKLFVNGLKDDEFFPCLGWPLLSLIKEKEAFNEFIQEKINNFFELEEEAEIDNVTDETQ